MTAAGAALLGATVSSSAARRTRSDPLARRRGTAGPRAYWVIGIKLVCSGQLTPKCSDCAGVMKLVALPLRSAWRKQDTAAQHLPAAKQKHVSCDETPLAHGPMARTPGRTQSQDRGTGGQRRGSPVCEPGAETSVACQYMRMQEPQRPAGVQAPATRASRRLCWGSGAATGVRLNQLCLGSPATQGSLTRTSGRRLRRRLPSVLAWLLPRSERCRLHSHTRRNTERCKPTSCNQSVGTGGYYG